MLNTIGLILLFSILFLVLLFVFFSFRAYFFGAPFVPSNYGVIKKVLDYTDIKEGSVFFDLGSGDGRVLLEAAKKGALAIGYELNPFWFFISKINVLLHGLNDKVTVKRENFMQAPFSEADILYLYLFPEKIAQIEQMLQKKLKKGAQVITYRFPFLNWKERKKFEKEKVFLYVKE
ncbi:MAG: hypothetical protein UR87_C0065G0009 [candidate division CPR3 bacterium GW2011_GWE2_35_7]|uniref:DOT1 domain-containing protein n=1 Tax=candidate division CPR3 bacterium GW2011_GWF2_35_18 TaxID=1618350 RepID=A0A0G0BLH1_UNCC3|nr:MAG: hypothetical protein UR67_C0001G0182 [candidate division CPR3 bacterium GW2011_GWF2_35_18]KKP84852.1 MAG: hypothetical protein UR87_C0065G0009 [candidate division CPR3 bacterium GW2011_GWE2_35_7]OGB77280.1 MAG: hypothetical protein A2476_03915 [candidate division CPR3 bacterium RIFOXYC2_FULL_35_7]